MINSCLAAYQWPTFRYDPSVTTKVLLISGGTAFAISCALASVWMALNIFYSVLEIVLPD